MDFQMTPTILWALLGIVLIILELVSFSFVLIFFGLAALIVSVLKFMGLSHLIAEIFIFSIAGLAGVMLFRTKLQSGIKSRSNDLITDINQQVILSESIPAGKSARIAYQGTNWTAHNASAKDLHQGDAVMIERISGINLYVIPTVVDIPPVQ